MHNSELLLQSLHVTCNKNTVKWSAIQDFFQKIKDLTVSFPIQRGMRGVKKKKAMTNPYRGPIQLFMAVCFLRLGFWKAFLSLHSLWSIQ